MSTKAKAQSQIIPKLEAPIQQDPEKLGGLLQLVDTGCRLRL